MTRSRGIPLPADQADSILRRIQVQAFWHLLHHGQPMPAEDLDTQDRQAVHELRERGRLTTTDDGRIAGSLGLTVLPTRHRIDLAEGIRYTWCALDAVAILAALRRSGTVTTNIPNTERALVVRYEDGHVVDAPDGAMLLIPAEPTGPVVQTWCPLANLFPDTDSAHSWARLQGVENYTLLTLSDALAQGTPLWTDILNDRSPSETNTSQPGPRC